MDALKIGATGAPVERLQKRLKKLGFDPGLVDGVFGAGTDAAVRAFQASESLVVDGIVGRRTLEALKLTRQVRPPGPFAMESVTVAVVADMFPGAPLGNIKTHLPNVLKAIDDDDLGDRPMVLMALATIRAETAGFVPIDEGKSRFNSSPNGHPFDLYDNRADLGNRGAPDGAKFKGRGFVQLTGRDNYRRIGQRLHVPLIQQPDLANDSIIAGRILAAFLKGKEIKIKQALVDGDLRRARRLVNGGSHGLDRFTECYQAGERLI